MAPFNRLHMSFYLSSTVNMSLSSSVTEKFSVKYWHDLDIWVRGSLRSLKIVQIDRPYTTLYWSALVAYSSILHHFRVI